MQTRCMGMCGVVPCSEIVRPRLFATYLPEPLLATYREFQLRSFVAASRVLKWCPAAGCTEVVRYAGGGMEVSAAAVAVRLSHGVA